MCLHASTRKSMLRQIKTQNYDSLPGHTIICIVLLSNLFAIKSRAQYTTQCGKSGLNIDIIWMYNDFSSSNVCNTIVKTQLSPGKRKALFLSAERCSKWCNSTGRWRTTRHQHQCCWEEKVTGGWRTPRHPRLQSCWEEKVTLVINALARTSDLKTIPPIE